MISALKLDTAVLATCYHCGEKCKTGVISFDDKAFCCDGCKLVYDLLKENSLCTYYNLNATPGISPASIVNSGKYNYLDNSSINEKLISFKDDNHTHITFYIPKIHCSSCIWLLENLHRLNKSITQSTVNFLRKEITIVFKSDSIKLSDVAVLLAHIGYEPLISLNDVDAKIEKKNNRAQVLKIGIAGFCFGNIMMLSFPEYFSFGNFYEQANLNYFFGYLNLFLALPVFFYSASDFFISAWKSIRYRYLNIDAPIALAILVTFLRSVYEIVSHTGAGYLDSMSGIVFFMLIGRFFQNRTYETLSFERNYKSYFPVAVTLKQNNGEESSVSVSELKKGDKIIIRNNELIPTDATLLSTQTHVDYSFITGESAPVTKKAGDFIYAGGKQLDGAIELEVMNPTSQSNLTQLWNKDQKKQKQAAASQTYVDTINKYFTIVVLSVSILSATYWYFIDSTKALNALTAVLIVACPCGLLLTTTFANGNMLSIFGKNKLYLKNANVINQLAKADTIIFDKTGTITTGSEVKFEGPPLAPHQLQLVTSLAAQSSHPLSKKIYSQYVCGKNSEVEEFEEFPGKGIRGFVEGKYVMLGSQYFITGQVNTSTHLSANVFLMIDGVVIGYFSFNSVYRSGLKTIIDSLKKVFHLQLLSGDNDAEKEKLGQVFGVTTNLHFNQQPEEKMNHVKMLQDQGRTVIMLGDGLNDSGALQQSDVGIAVSDDTNNFSPACDAILDGAAFAKLPAFIKLAKASKKIIIATFIISLTYNIIGLSFAVQGVLSPVIAAILMPISSVTIVLLSVSLTTLFAKLNRLA